MITSMTGFARAQAEHAGATIVWEVKSVNGKSVEARLRLPSGTERRESAMQPDTLTRPQLTLADRCDRVIRLVDGERATGQQLKVKAFGDAEAYNRWIFANGLGDDLKINILHAGPGTLWTDLEKAGLADLGAGQALQAPKK